MYRLDYFTIYTNSLTFVPLQFINQMACFTSHQLIRLPLLLLDKILPFHNYCLSFTMCSPITDFTRSERYYNTYNNRQHLYLLALYLSLTTVVAVTTIFNIRSVTSSPHCLHIL